MNRIGARTLILTLRDALPGAEIYSYNFLSRASVSWLLPLLILLLMPMALRADQYGDYGYTTNDPAVIVTNYTGSGGSVTIPDIIIGLPVTCVGSNAFGYCTSLTNVTISTNVTSIGAYAFEWCRNLTNVTIPNSMINIGDGAFTWCLGLKNVTIPNSISNIGLGVFSYSGLTSITVPESVTNIGAGAFIYCFDLTNAAIGTNVINIAGGAFQYTGLTDIRIPASVTSLGMAFSYCANLTAINVDSFNPTYSSVDGVLFNKNQTTLVECPGGMAGAYAIPDSVTNIGDSAFLNCHSLTSVAIPSGVINIGGNAFMLCNNLVNVTIPDRLTSIGAWSFYYCGLTNITIPKSVTSIGDGAFLSCQHLTGVYFQGNAPAIGSSVFDNNTIIYFLPGTTGWSPIFSGCQTMPWYLPCPVILDFEPSFGIHTNQFSFVISWTANSPVVVEACTGLANPIGFPVKTNTLTAGTSYFGDPDWTNYPRRFYRLRSP